MDPGWDHTENEDKLLLAHTSRVNMNMSTNVDITDEIRSVSVSGCSNDNLNGIGDRLSEFTSEYKNHTLTLAINNVNYIPISNSSFLFLFNKMFSINFHNYFYEQFYLFDGFINLICFDSSSTCTCKCNCSSKPQCAKNTICLCICSCSSSSSGSSIGCCVCICKHGDNCKCICICVCKNGDQCCCQSGSHDCKKYLVKVDIQSLKDKTCRILSYLSWIKCYISRTENQSSSGSNNICCCCSCCVGRCVSSRCCSYCCCKDGEVDYSSIISTINSVESLFNQISTEILKLAKIYKTLSLMNLITNTCKACPGNCCKDINSLIANIEKALLYYHLFGSRIEDIRAFVYYKIFYPNSKEIISSLEKLTSQLLKELNEKNYMITNVGYNIITNKLLMSCYSHYSLLSSLFFLIRVIQWAEFINDFLNTNDIADRCSCVKSFELSKIDKFYIKGYSIYRDNIDTSILSKLYKQTHGNHICLCLVFKYVFYPIIMSLLYYVFGTTLEIHGTFNRKFDNYNYLIGFNNDVSKMLIFIFHIISVIINIILKDSYVKWNSSHSSRIEVKCFCMSDKYDKNYMLNIILYLSSLMENIWSMDRQTFEVFVKNLSSFMWEFDAITKNNVSGSTEISKLKIVSMTLTQYMSKLSIQTTRNNVKCNDNGNSVIVLHTEIGKSQGMIVNKGIKLFFKSVLSSLSILIKTPLFSLVYSNISGLDFYLIGNGKIIGLSSGFLRNVVKLISVKYLDCTKKEQCNETCCVNSNNECKICIVGKINYLSLNITLNMIRCVLKIVIKHLMVDSLKLTKVKIEFVRNACVNFNIQMLRMTKNLQTNKDPVLRSYGNIGVTNVETRNWGYDTKYEHDVSTDNSIIRVYGYPYVTNCDRTDIHKISNSIRVTVYFIYLSQLDNLI